MSITSSGLLIGAVVAVGVLHTIVPDHWVPITIVARQHGWSLAQTARAAAIAGFGHTVSTLILAAIVFFAGVVVAQRLGHVIDIVSGIGLIAFGLWIAIASLHEARHTHEHTHTHAGHTHDQGRSSRTAILLILGSSPMVEGIPAFFAAAKYGVGLLIVMSIAFGLATTVTYVALCSGSAVGFQKIDLGPLERYGEVLSGAVIALIGAIFLVLALRA